MEKESNKRMKQARFRSDVTVELRQSMASDANVVQAARVSTKGGDSRGDEADAGLINYLIREGHASPLEHSTFQFYVEAPLMVMTQLLRHRMASYNVESARYKEFQPVFYVPDQDRKLVQVGKPGAYTFVKGNQTQYASAWQNITEGSKRAYERYQEMLGAGITREVARMVLPQNVYTSAYITINARSLMNLLSLRIERGSDATVSHPQYEIQMVAEKMEEYFKEAMPLVYAAWVKGGRVSP